MKRADVAKLLAGYATGTLTPAERDLLFQAALADQQLFDALADEQALKDLLDNAATRTRLLAELAETGQVVRKPWGWLQRPVVWGLAGTLAGALVLAVALRQPHPTPGPSPLARLAPPAAPSFVPASPALPPRRAKKKGANAVLPPPPPELTQQAALRPSAEAAGAREEIAVQLEAPVPAMESKARRSPLTRTFAMASDAAAPLLRWQLLQRRQDGGYAAVPITRDFSPGDELALRIEPNRAGQFEVAPSEGAPESWTNCQTGQPCELPFRVRGSRVLVLMRSGPAAPPVPALDLELHFR